MHILEKYDFLIFLLTFNYVTDKINYEFFVCNVSLLGLDVNKHGYHEGTSDQINNIVKIVGYSVRTVT